MIIAVLIFRYCDSRRKHQCMNKDIQASRPFSQHFLAYMIGKQLLQEHSIELNSLTHTNFYKLKEDFERNKEDLYIKAENVLTELLKGYFNTEHLDSIDGRTMAAAFRRFDIVENYFKVSSWWDKHMKDHSKS